MKRRGKVHYAVIGLGHIAQVVVLPAFRHVARNSELAALVSDDPEKLAQLGKRYRVEHRCGYEDADALFASGEIDAVYIALPNAMHADWTVRAARAGLHGNREVMDLHAGVVVIELAADRMAL